MTTKTQDIREIEVVAEGNPVVDQETFAPEKLLDELAGCLGQESATEYDFHLELAMR